MAGEEEVLAATARSGFLQPTTVAAVLGLEERLLLELVDRLGGEVYMPDFANQLATPIGKRLEAELSEGTYILRVVEE